MADSSGSSSLGGTAALIARFSTEQIANLTSDQIRAFATSGIAGAHGLGDPHAMSSDLGGTSAEKDILLG